LSHVVIPPTALPLGAGADDSALVLLLEQADRPASARVAAPSAAAIRNDVFIRTPKSHDMHKVRRSFLPENRPRSDCDTVKPITQDYIRRSDPLLKGTLMLTRRAIPVLVVPMAIAAGLVAVAPAASAADPTDTVVVNCIANPVIRPKQIVVTCADAGVAVTKINWTSWTANAARGTGTLTWNTCLPKTCVAGIIEKYNVRISLGRVASGPGINVFSRMSLAFPEGGPAAAETATYTLNTELG
jgi:hypothetical protein